jgi:hypothetical protein
MNVDHEYILLNHSMKFSGTKSLAYSYATAEIGLGLSAKS